MGGGVGIELDSEVIELNKFWIEYGPNVGAGCRYWITEVIELDNIVLDRFYCINTRNRWELKPWEISD